MGKRTKRQEAGVIGFFALIGLVAILWGWRVAGITALGIVLLNQLLVLLDKP